MSGIDLAAQKERLLTLKAEVTTRADRLDLHQRRGVEALEQDSTERALQTRNDDLIDALDMLAHQRLEEIELALTRLEAGTYRECARCGREIAAGRQDLIPETCLCAACAAVLT